MQRVQLLVGDPRQARAAHPWKAFDERVIGFLEDVSRSIVADPDSRGFPDLVSLGYWCRKSSLSTMAAMHDSNNMMVGRGVVFHIPPSNVPLNSAYSLICGLLGGNANIVRLSSNESPEMELLITHLARLLALPEHSQMVDRVVLLRYDHDDDVTAHFCADADARVVWGGDATVSRIRAIPAKPRTVDVAFADRVSLALIKAAAVLTLDDKSLEQMTDRFVVDSYTFGQNACSSPKLVVWHGSESDTRRARERFWPVVERVAVARDSIEPINFVNRLVELCERLATSDSVSELEGLGSPALRVSLKDPSSWGEIADLRFGTFSEAMIDRLELLGNLLDERTQTVSHFGYSSDEMRSHMTEIGLRGVDRVVPMGQALNFELVWDGYDLIGFLSRSVVVR